MLHLHKHSHTSASFYTTATDGRNARAHANTRTQTHTNTDKKKMNENAVNLLPARAGVRIFWERGSAKARVLCTGACAPESYGFNVQRS